MELKELDIQILRIFMDDKGKTATFSVIKSKMEQDTRNTQGSVPDDTDIRIAITFLKKNDLIETYPGSSPEQEMYQLAEKGESWLMENR